MSRAEVTAYAHQLRAARRDLPLIAVGRRAGRWVCQVEVPGGVAGITVVGGLAAVYAPDVPPASATTDPVGVLLGLLAGLLPVDEVTL